MRAWPVLLALLLSACGLGEPGLPPLRPAGEVSGVVWLVEPLAGVRVEVRDGPGGEVLGHAVSDAAGRFRVVLHRADGPVEVRAGGGPLPAGVVLRAAGDYREGMGVELHPGPFTTLNRLLAAHRPEAPPPFPVSPVDPAGDGPAARTRRHLLAALGQMARDGARANGDPDGQRFTAVTLFALMAADAGDGLLDGRAGAQALAFGVVPLSAQTYRARLGEALLAAAWSAGEDPVPLRPEAEALATAAGPAFPVPPPPLPAPQIRWPDPIERLGGPVTLRFAIDGPFRPWRIDARLDDVPLPVDPGREPVLRLDGRTLDDGPHRLTLTVEDLFGTTAEAGWDLVVDHTAPWIALDEAGPFAASPAVLRGRVGDAQGDTPSLTVAGQAVEVAADGTWEARVTLEEGENPVSLVVEDAVGNRHEETVAVVLDTRPPRLTPGPHGEANFTAGTTTLRAPLADRNEQAPIQRRDDGLSLGGTPMSRDALDAAAIPYFALTVDDPHLDAVELRLLHDEVPVGDWHPLPGADGAYLIPLVDEVLGAGWARTGPLTRLRVQVRARDALGHESRTEFTFHLDLRAADIPLAWETDPVATPLAATPFAQRATLLDADLETVAFLLDNRQGPARLLRLAPAPDGELERLYSEKRRRHRAVPVTHTEWRVAWLDLQAGCPDTPPPWTPVTRLWNYVGPGTGLDAWEAIAPPPPATGEPEWLDQDALPAPVEGAWTDTPDPDDILLGYQRNAAFTLSARFDYVADPADPLALDSPALIRDWHYEIPGDPGATRDCHEARYFQQRQVVIYESLPGYPRDDITARSEPRPLAALAPLLTDADDGTPLDAQDSPLGPVYRIPAGSRVRITLRHHSPALDPYDDPAATDPTVPGDYLQPQRLDQAYLWRLPRRLDGALYPDVPTDALPRILATPLQTDAGQGEYEWR